MKNTFTTEEYAEEIRENIKMKFLKTPLRYPGGKSKAIKKITPLLHLENIKEYREPFLGGGSIGLHFTKLNPDVKVWVNDLYSPLYVFWKVLKSDGKLLFERLKKLKLENSSIEKSRKLFLNSKAILLDKNITLLEKATRFYVVNKCSFSGLTESSSFSQSASQKNFTIRGIQNLLYYSTIIKNWKITNYSYEKLLKKTGKETLIYLDPPYAIKDNLYGKKGKLHACFNHYNFIKNVKKTTAKCVISYNDCNTIFNDLKDWQHEIYPLTYTMRSVGKYMEEQKKRKEVLFFNYKQTLVNNIRNYK